MTFVDIVFIGIGLSLDACCVCTSNGLVYRPNSKDAIKYGLVFAVFQGAMPLLGYWGVGKLNVKIFEYNSLIALILLSIVGGKMIYEALGENKENGESLPDDDKRAVSRSIAWSVLMIQGISTSIDALSVGITFYKYTVEFVLCSALLIATITWMMCFVALRIGIKIGTKLNSKAELVGGVVLILLGIKIFLVN